MKQSIYEYYGISPGLSRLEIDSLLAIKHSKTLKRLQKYGKRTMHEMVCIDACIKAFKKKNIETNVLVNGWVIDLYVKSEDVYVQIDSCYWNGLNRSLDVIAQFKNPRDKRIYETYLIDREQDTWFQSNQMMLARVTDEELLCWLGEFSVVENIVERVRSKMRGFSVSS